MEDTVIKPGMYAYQFRVDILTPSGERIYINPSYTNEQTNIDVIQESLANYREIIIAMLIQYFNYYFIFVENGGTTGKVHLQGVIWSTYNYRNTFMNKLKSKYFFRHRSVKNSLSITNAKRIKSLCSYVQKDGDSFLSNLDDEEVALFPVWVKKEERTKKQFKDKLEKKIITAIQSDNYTPSDVAILIINEYWNNGMRQPARMDIIKYLGWYHPNYKASDYLENINIFN